MKRIDLTNFKNNRRGWIQDWRLQGPMLPEVLEALKEAYDEIDKLEKALSIINSTHFPKE